MERRPALNRSDCLICGATENLTLEHIIPQALWARFGIDPNAEGDVRKTHTTLCARCNGATAALHTRREMLDLIQTGLPVTDATVAQMADWAFWVLLLLNLARGSHIVPERHARDLLQKRFVTHELGGVPKAWRIYAAHVSSLTPTASAPTRYEVALTFEESLYRGAGGRPIRVTVSHGDAREASLVIGIGIMVFLVLPPTASSGPGHFDRINAVAAAADLERLVPRHGEVVSLRAGSADIGVVRDLFVAPLAGDDRTLLPPTLRALFQYT